MLMQIGKFHEPKIKLKTFHCEEKKEKKKNRNIAQTVLILKRTNSKRSTQMTCSPYEHLAFNEANSSIDSFVYEDFKC